jgi:hypothetical protein
VAENTSFSHIYGMVFSSQGEPLVEDIGWKWVLTGQEGVGLLPGSLTLVCTVVASRIKWHHRLVDKGRELFFHIFCKLLRLGAGFIYIS